MIDTSFQSSHLAWKLKMLHQDRITHLQNKISEQQQEILKLQEQIRLLSYEKEYDC